MSKVFVSSEIGTLKRVIVHRPDKGIDRISPKRAEELLFDDIVFLEKMQEEHDLFREVLDCFLGKENVLETEDLLLEALEADPTTKKELLDLIANFEELPDRDIKLINGLDNKELRDLLITGHCESADCILFDPIPNFIFTRDIAVTVNDHVVITKAAREARFRENLLTRFIFFSHPIFTSLREDGRLINLNNVNQFPPSRFGEHVSIEGGDMMCIHKDYLLIGCSERTTEYAIHLLRDHLFKNDVINNVVQVNIPADRSFMHIDTIFTQIDKDLVVGYKPLIDEGLSSNCVVYRKDGSAKKYNSISEFFRGEINFNMRFIFSGGGYSPYQEREQWTDGCNLVAIKPGVALIYDRNVKTIRSFKEEAGYQVLSAHDFIAGVKAGDINPKELTNTLISLDSGELSRARGGSHCMTCPIERA